MSSTGNAHLLIQLRQENFIVNGVKCSNEVQENEKHQVPPSALHKTLLRTLRRQNHNCDLGGMLTETCQGHAGVDGINCSATAHSRSLEAQGRFKTG